MSKAHIGFCGSSGVQSHSAGDDYPVRTECIGSADCRVAVAFGVRRISYNDLAGHKANVELLKRAERITDAVCAAFADRDGCSVWLCDAPESGYCVGSAGWETAIENADVSYNAVFADIVEKLEFIDYVKGSTVSGRDVCIGSWCHDGRLYLDISCHHDDRANAIAWGRANDQIAIWDIAGGIEIPV